jgi:hypothetical protein
LVDRDGNPILTIDRRPIALLVNEQGQPVLDAEGTVIAVRVLLEQGHEAGRDGGSGVGGAFVALVAGGLDLDGGVVDVEVAAQAVAEPVQDLAAR